MPEVTEMRFLRRVPGLNFDNRVRSLAIWDSLRGTPLTLRILWSPMVWAPYIDVPWSDSNRAVSDTSYWK